MKHKRNSLKIIYNIHQNQRLNSTKIIRGSCKLMFSLTPNDSIIAVTLLVYVHVHYACTQASELTLFQ